MASVNWYEKYGPNTRPTFDEIAAFIGSGLWDELRQHIEEAYKVSPLLEYSGCSAQPGWNIKYKKSSRSLCTLYPMPGYFIALVVIGAKEQADTEFLLPSLSEYSRALYAKVPFSMGGRWLMMEVRDEAVLADAKTLIRVRAQAKK